MADDEDIFVGKWYKYPLMRNAIISGLLSVSAFGLDHTGRIPSPAEISIFLVAIVIGGYHWSLEGIEELIKEKKVGIEILMMAATHRLSAVGNLG